MAAGSARTKTSGKTTAKKKTTGAKKSTAAAKTTPQKAPGRTKSAPAPERSTAAAAARERESRRFWSYILFFWGVLELLLTFIPGDGFWNTLHLFNRGMFGSASYMFAPLLIYVALMVASDTTHNAVVAKSIEGGVLMLLGSGMMQIIQVGRVEGSGFVKKLAGLYNDGKELRGGGLASAVLGWPLLAVFKKVGATIIMLLIAFTFIMLLTDITLPELFRMLSKPFVKGYTAVTEDRIERAVRQQERAPRPRVELTSSNGNTRVDIAKYFPDDDPDTAAEVYTKLNEGEEPDDILPFLELENMPKHPATSAGAEKTKREPAVKEKETVVSVQEDKADMPTEDKPQDLDSIIRQALGSEKKDPPKPELPKNEPVSKGKKAKAQPVDAEAIEQEIQDAGQEENAEYEYPPVELLKYPKNAVDRAVVEAEIQDKSQKLVETLETFGVKTRITGIYRGPSVTRYELQMAAGIKVSKILGLVDNIALSLAALSIRMEAPVPGKNCIGVEVPNNHRDTVSLRELIDSEEYRKAEGKLTFAVGKDIEGKIVIGNIAKMPHLLVAGTTGSGKSVFTNSIILSVLFHASPSEVKLILIDPKKVEFNIYNKIPHLLIPVVTEPLKAAGALGWAVNEMTKRYIQFEANDVKNLDEFNDMVNEEKSKPVDQQDPVIGKLEPMPQILIVIDEFADLMMAARSEVEDSVLRLGQLARAAGIHMIIATQSPRKDVITGLIKSNIPSRVALSVSGTMDSMVIFDQGGAEKLLGNGDLFYKPVGVKTPIRIQSGFASTKEIKDVVDFLKREHSSEYSEEIMYEVEKNMPKPKEDKNGGEDEEIVVNPDDKLIDRAISIILQSGVASTSYLQRKMSLGYAKAAKIMDEIEDMGIIGPKNGAKPREIYISNDEWMEMRARR